jgi:hypothetical protein
MPRVGQPVRKLAVIRHEDQSLAGDIQPADAKHSRRVGRQKIGDARAAGRVASCRNDACRLVDGEVDELGLR